MQGCGELERFEVPLTLNGERIFVMAFGRVLTPLICSIPGDLLFLIAWIGVWIWTFRKFFQIDLFEVLGRKTLIEFR